MNSPGFGMAARIEACCKASCSKVVQNGLDNAVSVKILQLFTYGDTEVIQSNDSVFNAQFTRR